MTSFLANSSSSAPNISLLLSISSVASMRFSLDCILYSALLHLSLRSALIPVTSKLYRFESLIQSLNSFFVFRFFLFEYLSHVPLHFPHTPPQSLLPQTPFSLLISPFSLVISFWVAFNPISSPSFPISPLHYSDLALFLSFYSLIFYINSLISLSLSHHGSLSPILFFLKIHILSISLSLILYLVLSFYSPSISPYLSSAIYLFYYSSLFISPENIPSLAPYSL